MANKKLFSYVDAGVESKLNNLLENERREEVSL